jgi:hypothetical protein
MHLDECKSVAEQCLGSVDGVEAALGFFHDTGEIVHLWQHSQLRERVFLSPSWIIEVIRAIVSHKYEHGQHLEYRRDVADSVGLLERDFHEAINALKFDAVASWKLLQYAWASRSATADASLFPCFRALLVQFGVGVEHDHQALLLPCYLLDRLDPLVLERWPQECPAGVRQTCVQAVFPMFRPAGLMEQLLVACSEHMKHAALSKTCAYMEAKHTGDQLLIEQDPPGAVLEHPAIQITLRWKPDTGRVLHSVLESLRKLIAGALAAVPV